MTNDCAKKKTGRNIDQNDGVNGLRVHKINITEGNLICI